MILSVSLRRPEPVGPNMADVTRPNKTPELFATVSLGGSAPSDNGRVGGTTGHTPGSQEAAGNSTAVTSPSLPRAQPGGARAFP